MNFGKIVVFCCVMIHSNIVALPDREERSGEVLEEQEIKGDNETSLEAGPPDSHEAMNNREINPRIREKRSYEFLMGLINNNSRYEVTKVDPSVITEKPKTALQDMDGSELLLELMVRIAAHPGQWDKVHTLLQNIDRDLTTSRNILNNLKSNADSSEASDSSREAIRVNKKEASNGLDEAMNDGSKEVLLENSENNDTLQTYERPTKWPNFDEEDQGVNVKFVNNTTENDGVRFNVNQRDPWQLQNRSTKSTYPKNFSYHRVTGKPIYLNKNPKAYIAVSVIAPKQINIRSKEDEVSLENELHQLKPWTHTQNLKNIAKARSKWTKKTDETETYPVVPKLIDNYFV